MKQEEKNALARSRILTAALAEFADKGYAGASLNAVWAHEGIAKGVVYHYYKDTDEIYLALVKSCFDLLRTDLMQNETNPEMHGFERLTSYFHARLQFFAQNPLYLDLFLDIAFHAPTHLAALIATERKEFDRISISILRDILNDCPLREGLTIDMVAEELSYYMDYSNMRFRSSCDHTLPPLVAFSQHEEISQRRLNIFLFGILERR